MARHVTQEQREPVKVNLASLVARVQYLLSIALGPGMSISQRLMGTWKVGKVSQILSRLTNLVSIYVIGALIFVALALALVIWPAYFPASSYTPLNFQVLEETSGGDLSPEMALGRVRTAPRVSHVDTGRSEAPYWVLLSAKTANDAVSVIEFPSRHGRELVCWDALSLQVIGYGSRSGASGDVRPVRSGFGVKVRNANVPLLCRASFVGPARLSAVHWDAPSLASAENDFARKSGLLDGGIFMLAVFMIITAVVVKERLYILFGLWLILHARMATLSFGADIQLLGSTFPDDYILRSRLLTTALFSLSSVSLFLALFHRELGLIRARIWAPALQAPALILVVLSATLPYKDYLPYLWIHTTWMVVIMIWLMSRVILHVRSSVGILCCVAMCVALTAGMAEVLGAAYGWRWLTDIYNHVHSALVSSVLCTLSIAEHFRQEHRNREIVQERLEQAFNAMPVGLFTLNLAGEIVSANPAFLKAIGQRALNATNNRWEHHFSEGSVAELFELVQVQPDARLVVEGKEVAGGSGASRKRFSVRASLTEGQLEGYMEDITERDKAFAQYRHLASHDAVTDCLNQRGAQDAYLTAIAELGSGKPTALAYVSLTNFRIVEEIYGSNTSEEVLRQIARTISVTVGANYGVGRIGYDNFVIIMPDTSIDMAKKACETLLLTFEQADYRTRSNKLFFASAVISVLEVSHAIPWQEALASVTQACSTVKGTPERLVCLDKNSPVLRAQAYRAQIASELREGRMPAGAYLEIQPIISATHPHAARNGEIVLRCNDAEGMGVPGDVIFAAAVEHDLTSVVDEWVITRSLEWIEANIELFESTMIISVDVHAASLRDQRFVTSLCLLFREKESAARKLCIDVPAAAAMEDVEGATWFMDMFFEARVRSTLSEFGAGKTVLTSITRLPAVALKLDGSVLNDPALVEAIISLAHNRGMLVLADGVNHTITASTLLGAGVRYIQGPAVSPSVALSAFLSAHAPSDFVTDPGMKSVIDDFGDQVPDSFMGLVDFSKYQ